MNIRMRGGHTSEIPREAIAAIHVPRGEIELFVEDFEGQNIPSGKRDRIDVTSSIIEESMLDSGRSVEGHRSLRLSKESTPFLLKFHQTTESRVQFYFRIDPRPSDVGAKGEAGDVDFEFESGMPSTYRIGLVASGDSVSLDSSETDVVRKKTISLRPGWHCLTAVMSANQGMWTVDDSVLSFQTQPPTGLRSIRFSANANLWIDAIQIIQSAGDSREDEVRPSTQDDVVSGSQQVQWFGRVKRIDSNGVLLALSGRDRLLSWGQVSTIGLRQTDRHVQERFALPVGLVAEVEFQSFVDRPQMPSDQLTVSILEVNKDFLVAVHPWLGRLAISWTDILAIRPQFFGQLLYLDARHMHLGDSIHSDFLRQVPDGTEWSGDFELPAGSDSPSNQIWLELDVSEMEPSGSETPIASPFLRELRDGQLLTELTINERAVGDLNHYLRFRPNVGRPERLRIPISAGLCRSGRNSFRLNQLPGLKGGKYDNCELSNLRLEIVSP